MIKKIHLKSFGKFRNYQLPCAPVTIIEGANESGKTTLFDALLEGLCKPKGTLEAGKLLKARYGEARSVSLEFEGDPLQLSAADFLNLFAIRAGDLSVEVSKDSEWLSRVKAQLFSGGLDPLAVADELNRQCSSRAKNTLNGELQELREKVTALERQVQELKSQREAALQEERESLHSEGELEKVRSELESLRREEERLSRSLEQQNLHRARKELWRVQATLESVKGLKQELEEMPAYSEEEQGNLRTLEQRVQDLDIQMQTLRTREDEARKELQTLQPEMEHLTAQSRKIQQIYDSGVYRKNRLIQDRPSLIQQRVYHTFRPVFLLLGVLALLLGVGGAWILPRDVSILPLVAGVLGFALLGFLGIRRQTKEDDSKFRNAVEEACRDWEKEGGDPIPDKTWEGFLGVLAQTEERLRNVRARLEELHAKEGHIRKRIETLQEEQGACRHAREEAGNALKATCERLKVRDSTHYTAQREKRLGKEAQLRELQAQIEEACRRYGQTRAEELGAFILMELERIRPQITEAELPEAEVSRLENLVRKRRDRREALEQEEKRLIQIVHRKKGEVSGAYRDLPERIVKTEQELFSLKALLQEKELSLKGAERAAEIFRSLSADNDALLSSLSEEIARTFTRIAPPKGEGKAEIHTRKVTMRTFSLKETEVMDAAGNLRPFGFSEKREVREGVFLSTGTRDAFLLAARLTLARKAVQGGGEALLVMDEPFLTLDSERVDRAIEVLKEFQQATGWQIFLFTKEEALAEKVESQFGRQDLGGLARRVKLD